jgi:hypothetical protein
MRASEAESGAIVASLKAKQSSLRIERSLHQIDSLEEVQPVYELSSGDRSAPPEKARLRIVDIGRRLFKFLLRW